MGVCVCAFVCVRARVCVSYSAHTKRGVYIVQQPETENYSLQLCPITVKGTHPGTVLVLTETSTMRSRATGAI